MARGGPRASGLLVRPRPPVRGRAASRHRPRRTCGRFGGRAGVRRRHLRGQRAIERLVGDDPDRRRAVGDAHASRFDRRRAQCGRDGGSRGRNRRPEWHAGGWRAIRALRDPHHIRPAGLPRPARADARDRAARGRAGRGCAARAGATAGLRAGSATGRGGAAGCGRARARSSRGERAGRVGCTRTDRARCRACGNGGVSGLGRDGSGGCPGSAGGDPVRRDPARRNPARRDPACGRTGWRDAAGRAGRNDTHCSCDAARRRGAGG